MKRWGDNLPVSFVEKRQGGWVGITSAWLFAQAVKGPREDRGTGGKELSCLERADFFFF